ncbi:MAG: hypothetical protein AAF558_15505 [Verrucomicrobiota bacterium]
MPLGTYSKIWNFSEDSSRPVHAHSRCNVGESRGRLGACSQEEAGARPSTNQGVRAEAQCVLQRAGKPAYSVTLVAEFCWVTVALPPALDVVVKIEPGFNAFLKSRQAGLTVTSTLLTTSEPH